MDDRNIKNFWWAIYNFVDLEPLLRIGDVCWEETQHFSQWNEADSDLFGEKCFDMMIIYNCRKYQEQAQQATISRKLFL